MIVREHGVILFSVLIILFIFTMLGFEMLNDGILQIKMDEAFSDKLLASNAAETGLALAYAKILGNTISPPKMRASYHFQINWLQTTRCATRYLLSSSAKLHNSRVKLIEQVKVVKIPRPPKCQPEPSGQKIIAWCEVN